VTSHEISLLAFLFSAHFLGDFTPLATRGMLDAKAVGKPLGPIASHAAVHAVLVGLAVALVVRPGPGLIGMAALVEFGAHLAIDWVRGRLGGHWPTLSDPAAQAYWTALGLDQLAHAFVLIGIAALVL
jgi:hypothetical protein